MECLRCLVLQLPPFDANIRGKSDTKLAYFKPYISIIRGIRNSPDTVFRMQCQRHWLCKKSSQDQATKDDKKQTHVDPELH